MSCSCFKLNGFHTYLVLPSKLIMVMVVEHQKACCCHVSACLSATMPNGVSPHAHLKVSLADWSGSLHLYLNGALVAAAWRHSTWS